MLVAISNTTLTLHVPVMELSRANTCAVAELCALGLHIVSQVELPLTRAICRVDNTRARTFPARRLQ